MRLHRAGGWALLALLTGCSTAPTRPRSPADVRVAILIDERLDGTPSQTPYAAETFTAILAGAGYKVLERSAIAGAQMQALRTAAGKSDAPTVKALGAKLGVELLLLGTGEGNRVEPPVAFADFSSYRAHASAKLVRTDSAQVLASASAQEGGLDLDPKAAAAKALQDAAKAASAELLPRLSQALGFAAADPQPSVPSAARPGAFPASEVDAPTARAPENARNFALIVGVETYSDLPPAMFAERDAEAVRRHMEALGYPARNIIHLSGARAVRSALEKYIEDWLPKNVGPDGRVFFYFSGHGAPQAETGKTYLVPWDGDAAYLERTGYPLEHLYARLGALKAKEVIVVVDACFSGGGGRSVLPKGARPLVARLVAAEIPKDRLTVFTAASGDQITGTLDEHGHGIFTYFFLKGLSGAAKNASGAVTAQGLFQFLNPHVQDAARRQNRNQTPSLEGRQDLEMIGF